MTAHARLSPSDWSRWSGCPGSIRLTEHIKKPTSIFASEGSAAHLIRAECLELGLDAQDFLGQSLKIDGFEFEVVEDWVRWLQPGIDWTREQKGDLVVEHRVDLSRWMPGQFGTADSIIVAPDCLTVADFKFGAGEVVEAEENGQLLIYALGAWDNIAEKLVPDAAPGYRIRLVIDQPRAGGISVWETTLGYLLEFGEKVRVAAARTYEKGSPLAASAKGCRWCAIRTECGEHARFVLDLFATKFEDLDEADMIGVAPTLPNEVTPERRSYIIQHASMFSKWLADLSAAALADALAGRPTPGLKAVLGRAGAREWRDPDEAAKALAGLLKPEQVFESKVISPTTAEKRLKTKQWEQVEGLVTRSPAQPTLAAITDKRPAIEPVATKFDEVSDDN